MLHVFGNQYLVFPKFNILANYPVFTGHTLGTQTLKG